MLGALEAKVAGSRLPLLRPRARRHSVDRDLAATQDRLHATGEHRARLLLDVRLAEHHVLVVVPLARGDLFAGRVLVHCVVLRAKEVRNRVAVLDLALSRGGDHAVEARVELLPAEEAERVPDVDRSVPARARLDERPAVRLGRPDLKAPLLAEEQRDRADVGVLVVPDGVVRVAGRRVVQHDKRRVRLLAVAVKLLKPRRPDEAKGIGEALEQGVCDEVGEGDEAVEQRLLLFDVLGELGGLFNHLGTSDLVIHTVLGAVLGPRERAHGLESVREG